MSEKDLKTIVKEKYSRIALQADSKTDQSCCCAPASDCCGVDFTVFSESYENLEGYNTDADLGLGCGIPTEFAGLKAGQHVLDLGSGAGNDCFIARAIVGESGFVAGLDFSEEMLAKARSNATKLGYENVDFVEGDIENMPFAGNQFDVIISNCVLNLVPDKQKAFSEILRVLKPGGHFCVSDVVIIGEMPEKLRADAELYAGCVSGAMQMDEYLAVAESIGFKNLVVHKKRKIEIPENLLRQHLDEEEVKELSVGALGLFSITLSATK
jgi:ubiquinone/menaquinone biosynthesis C-methylase UbiE